MFQEVGVCMGFQRGAGWSEFGFSQPGGKSCWAVWWSGLWCSGTVFLMVGAGRDCGRGGWGPSWCCCFAGASCKENVQDGWERGTDDLCSRVHCPLEGLTVSSTAVPYQTVMQLVSTLSMCPCRMWWGWVEGDLLFSAGGESVGAVVPSWRVTWVWWSRWDPPWCGAPVLSVVVLECCGRHGLTRSFRLKSPDPITEGIVKAQQV